MADAPWDAIVAGQGLAGTTLALHLVEAGLRVLAVDAEETVTSSKIAAGLITPITGQRLALSWRIGEVLPVAQKFYAGIEARTGKSFFHARTAVRLFTTGMERHEWSRRSLKPEFQTYLTAPQPVPLLEPEIGDADGGGFAMQTALLDVTAYLQAARALLTYMPMRIDWHHDVAIGPDAISVQGQRTKLLISCEGVAAAGNPYFAGVPFKPAKGNILTVRFNRPMPPVALHRGIWVAPTADADVFRVGATYDWQTLDCVPDAAARTKIEAGLQDFICVPYTVTGHQAAVRPIIRESKALIGLHPQHDRIGYFNGLGSKGALHAPWFAKCLTDHLVHGVPVPDEVNVRNWL